jgi:hypothetical protein
MKRGRAVKPAERPTYDACHVLMLAGTIYRWWIDNETGRWSVYTTPKHLALSDVATADVAALVAYLADVDGIDARYLTIVAGRGNPRRDALQRALDGSGATRKPSELARLRARVAELEAILAASGLEVAA